MVKVEVLYPFGGARRGDVVEVPEDKVGALRRLRWAREIQEEAPPRVAARPRKARQGKEQDVDGSIPST